MKLSIIILSWNTRDLLKDCLESIDKHGGYEIIVVDNGSTDDSIKVVRNFQFSNPNFQIKLIKNKKNLGFAKGNNQGIKIATGKYILLLNSDTVVKKGALKKLAEYLEKNQDVAAVSPMLLNPDGSKQIDYYMRLPNLWQIIFYHSILLRPLIMKTPLKRLIVSSPDSSNSAFVVDQLPGAALMASKKVFETTDGLDEDYPFLFEDVDWCYRVRQENLGKLMVFPQVEIIHLGGGSWKKWLRGDRLGFYQHYFRSLLLFVEKHHSSRLFLFKLALGITFLNNALTHLLFLNFKKSKVQASLLLWILGKRSVDRSKTSRIDEPDKIKPR